MKIIFFVFLFVVGTFAAESTEDCEPEVKCDFESFVSNVESVQGLHVLCITKQQKREYEISGYHNGYFWPNEPITYTFKRGTLSNFRKSVEVNFKINSKFHDSNNHFASDPTALQPWAIFTGEGKRLSTISEVLDSKMVLVFEGGQFIWPGVKIGFRRHVVNVPGKPDGITLETLSLRPLVLAIENFLEPGECDQIRSESEMHMAASPVAHKDGDVGKPDTEWRTSTQHWLPSRGKDWLMAIDERVEALTAVPANHQEHVQVLRYHPGQKYDAHHDFFDINHYQKNEQIKKMLHYGTNNRLATVFWYITDVAEGGSTWFPKAFKTPQPGLPGGAKSFASCEPGVGLHSYPRKGKVIIFYSLLPDGETDDTSLHAGCPPKSDDTKWSANKWIWNKPKLGY